MLSLLMSAVDVTLTTHTTDSSYLTLPNILLLSVVLIGSSIYYFVYSHNDSNAPPYVNIFYKLITRQFNFLSDGPLSIIWYGYQCAGDAFRLQLAHQPVTVLLGPTATAAFFNADDDTLSQKEVYHFVTPVFGKGLVYDAPQNVLTQQLKFLSHGLSSMKITEYAQRVVDEATTFFNDTSKFGDSGTIDLYHIISELTINTASSTLLGNEIRSNVQNEFAIYYHNLSMGMTPLSFFLPNIPIEAHRKRDAARREIVKLFYPIIQSRREQQRNNPSFVKPRDFLQDLIDVKYTDKRSLTDDEIVGMLVAALFAGQHTSNITATWMILSLIHNNYVSDVLEEQKRILHIDDGTLMNNDNLNYETVQEMSFLDQSLHETLRLFPPLIFLMRKVKKPLVVHTTQNKSYTVPVGDIVAVSPAVSGRLESVWSDPLQYNPHRFGTEWKNKQAELKSNKIKDYTFMGFGGGRHECLGRRFALMQIKTIVSVMFRTFELSLTDEFPVRDFDAMVVGPVAPTKVHYKRRK